MDKKSFTLRELMLLSLGSGVVAFLITAGAAYVLYLNKSEILSAQTQVPSISSQETIVTSVVERANPAVVSVIVTKDVPVLERYYERIPFGNGAVLRIPHVRQRGTQEQEVGGGSGFIVSPTGLMVTNSHVVSDPEASYTAFTNDGKKYDVEVVARDDALDIAVLKIKNFSVQNMPYLTFGDTSTLKLGQTAIAIGNALGEFRNSVSVGVISGLSRSITAGDGSGRSEQFENVIQTDAAINPGNSGGPLLDLRGLVIGVNVAVAGGAENIGFALPVDAVKRLVASVSQ